MLKIEKHGKDCARKFEHCFEHRLISKTESQNEKQPLEMFYKKSVLKDFTKFTGKHLCRGLFVNKETLAQVFSSKFCEIFKNIIFTEHL